jgi:hypothetical protein
VFDTSLYPLSAGMLGDTLASAAGIIFFIKSKEHH